MKYHLKPYWALILLLGYGCKGNYSSQDENYLVRVGDKVLPASVINQLLPEKSTGEDSTAIVNGYIENWVRDNLVILEAEKNIPADLNLNKLVNDYRASLLMYHYENQYIKNKLDTVITEDQKKEFYDEYGAQFILSHDIVKAIIINAPQKQNTFRSWANNARNMESNDIITSSKNKKFRVISNGKTWIPSEDLKSYISSSLYSKLKKGYTETYNLKNDQYFVKIIDYYKQNEIPPLEYIDEKIEQVMLNTRKTRLLKSLREVLYQKNMNEGNIKYN